MQDILDFIFDFLSERGISFSKEELGGVDYFEKAVLDSFETLSLIMALSNEFGVNISPKELLLPSLRTFGGLAEFVHGHMQK